MVLSFCELPVISTTASVLPSTKNMDSYRTLALSVKTTQSYTVTSSETLTMPTTTITVGSDMGEKNGSMTTDTPIRSPRTAVAVGVAVLSVILFLIIAIIAAYFIVKRVKGPNKPSATLPSVHYQPNADICLEPGFVNAIYSPGTLRTITIAVHNLPFHW